MRFQTRLQYLLVFAFCFLPPMVYGLDIDELAKTMSTNDIKPLTKPEVIAALSGKTMHESLGTYDYMMYQAPDHTLKGKAWGSWGEERDTGTWYVTEEGLYCSRWSGRWARYGIQCSVVYPGEKKGTYIRAIVKGKKTPAHPSGIYSPTVVAGDQT